MTRFTSTNPATGETVWEGEAATTEQVGAAIEASSVLVSHRALPVSRLMASAISGARSFRMA